MISARYSESFIKLILGKRSQVEILSPEYFDGSRAQDLPECMLDALTTELWDTRSEQGHILMLLRSMIYTGIPISNYKTLDLIRISLEQL